MNFDNTYHKLPDRFYAEASSSSFSEPKLLKFNEELASELGLSLGSQLENDLALIFSGQKLLKGSQPIAQAYAAHQFGHFVPQLGDGRAMLLGEVVASSGKRFDIQLKGAGPTAFSRNGDGKSAIGPVIREYIVSEAMYHLGVPTTRALAAVTTGDLVYREVPLPGAVFTRVASSHIRIGTFQYFAARGDIEGLKILLDYAIDRHYPEIHTELREESCELSPALLFLRKVIKAQISLVTKWMSLGFIHGVMNTDNMSISGETIDYGPCAFMDKFESNKVFSFIDRKGRYSYKNQGAIVRWNLSRLAECLIPLVDPDESKASELLGHELSTVSDLFERQLAVLMHAKIGLSFDQYSEGNHDLIKMWLDYLEEENLDFTLSFRNIASLLEGSGVERDRAFKETIKFKTFRQGWEERLEKQSLSLAAVRENMNTVNPLYIPRNHQVERAIELAIEGDLKVFDELNQVLKNPFTHQPAWNVYEAAPTAEEEVSQTFCGT